MVFGDETVPCQAKSYPPDPDGDGQQTKEMHCVLPADGHTVHEMEWS